jgi:hypothetical protein
MTDNNIVLPFNPHHCSRLNALCYAAPTCYGEHIENTEVECSNGFVLCTSVEDENDRVMYHKDDLPKSVETIAVEAVFACGHTGSLITTIDTAGEDVSIARSSEMCPACDQMAADEMADLWMSDSSFDSEF